MSAPSIPTATANIVNSDGIKSFKKGAHYWTGKIRISDGHLVDEHGRIISLRGVNLTGNSKLPTNPLKSSVPMSEEFFDHKNVSFVGRPFSPEDAHEHFERLNNWGLTFARLLVPWEALEHKGPGLYDEEYIDSLIKVLEIAPKYGIKCFIDPHQDTWSRYSGGSGAPGWTFEVVGLNIHNFESSGAAHYHSFEDETQVGKMIWPTNYVKLASATMFSVFFGGDKYCPKTMYRGIPAHQFLLDHYLACYAHLAKRLKGVEGVIGMEAMNEPHPGYIGMEELSKFHPTKDLRLACSPLPLQSFALGMGQTMEVDYFVKSWPYPYRKNGTRILNKEKTSAWIEGKSCIWKEHGVWDFDKSGNPVLLKKHYFAFREDGSKVDFMQDFYRPFLKKFALAIRDANPDLIFLFEPIPNEDPPNCLIDGDLDWHENCVYAPHWYDLHSVFNKKFSGFLTHDVQGLSRGMSVFQASYFGVKGARRNYTFQISNIVKHGLELLGKKPCLIGECGIPMDINEKRAFANGDYTHHNNFLDAVLSSMEINLVHFTLWNYNPQNNNEYGDYWNGEDFSIFSKPKSTIPIITLPKHESPPKTLALPLATLPVDSPIPPPSVIANVKSQSTGKLEEDDSPQPPARLMRNGPQSAFDLIDQFFHDMNAKHVGGRALDAVVRPYAAKISGQPIFSLFELKNTAYELVFITPKNSPNLQTYDKEYWTTEIYVPQFHFGVSMQPEVVVSDGNWLFDPNRQTIYWTINPNDAAPNPLAKDAPQWHSCPKRIATPELIEGYHFHTFQMSKSKSLAGSATRTSTTSKNSKENDLDRKRPSTCRIS